MNITFSDVFFTLPIFWPWTVTIYIFRLPFRCAWLLTITEKRLTSVLLFFLTFFFVRLSGICYRSRILVPCCAVVFYGVVDYFSQYWSFLLRFWPMLEITSRWVKLEFSCLWCCLSRRWFTVASLCCLSFQDLVFGDLTFMLFFIVRGWLHNLLISFRLLLSLYSLISLHLHSWSRLWWLSLSPYLLLQGWIVFFSMYALCAWKVVYGFKLELWFLGGWLPFFPTLVVYLLLMRLFV